MATEPQRDENSGKEPSPVPSRKGWLDDLAQRSAGVTPPATPSSDPDAGKADKTAWSYAGLGIEFAVTTAIFALMGVFVDRHFNTLPWGTLVLSSVGFVGGMYLLIKGALKENAEPRKGAGKRSPPQG